MTEAQVRFRQMRETVRHDFEQERNWRQTLLETQRANRTRESLTKYATDVQKWSTKVNSQTSMYVARTNAATQQYSAKMGYAATKYAADVNARTQRYISDQNAAVQRSIASLQAATSRANVFQQTAAQRYGSDQAAAASRYSALQSATASRYATDTNARVAQQKQQLDYQVQLVRNGLEAQRVQLQRLSVQADSAYKQAQVEQIATNIVNSTEQVALKARELDLQEEAQKYTNALNRARTWETGAKTANELTKLADWLLDIFGVGKKDLYGQIKSIFSGGKGSSASKDLFD